MQKVLVIEMDPEIRRHVHEVLEASGYGVLTAAYAQEGLRLLREELIDIVLIELLILGTDGLPLIRQLHRMRLTAKIIAMTDDIGNWPAIMTASRFGARRFLQKPFSRQKLLEVVNSFHHDTEDNGTRSHNEGC